MIAGIPAAEQTRQAKIRANFPGSSPLVASTIDALIVGVSLAFERGANRRPEYRLISRLKYLLCLIFVADDARVGESTPKENTSADDTRNPR